MINLVEIRNFKAIEEISLHLGRFNIFVGPNNSGKSSVLQAIQFAVGTAQTARKMAKNLTKDKISFSANASSFSYLPIKDIEALIHNRNLTQSKGSEVKFVEDDSSTTIEITRGKNRNFATTMTNSPLLQKIISQQPYCVITPGVSGISISEEYRAKAAVFKSATRGDSNLFLRNILLLLKDKTDAWKKFNKKFCEFFPDYTLDIAFDESLDENINVFVNTSGGVQLPIDALGTSALQILQILSYVFCFTPQMMILDEPDTHLHPNNQRKLINVLNELSQEEDMQILLSTHSRHMIDESSGIATFFCMQDGKLDKKFSDTDDTDYAKMLFDLGAFDRNDLMKNPNIRWVICTEDARVERDRMLKCILEASGFDLSSCVVLPYNGCSKIENAILLNRFIRQYAPHAKMIIHRDRDYLDNEHVDSLKSKLQKEGIELWCTPGTDVEAIFVNCDHIHTLYPSLHMDQILVAINEAKQETKEKSLERFVNYTANNTNERDYRKINRECEQAYDQQPDRYFYGKKAYGVLKSKLQTILKENPCLFSKTIAIAQPDLQKIIVS